jgi:hypothetical protein
VNSRPSASGFCPNRSDEAADALNQSLEPIVVGVSRTRPSVKRVALELSNVGAAKLGIVRSERTVRDDRLPSADGRFGSGSASSIPRADGRFRRNFDRSPQLS